MVSYSNLGPYQFSSPSFYSSSSPFSYSYPAPAPYPYASTVNEPSNGGYSSNAAHPAYPSLDAHCISYPGIPTMNRSELFQIKNKFFKSIGCWNDNSVRAIESMEGKHRLLKDLEYRSRVNALMKCAEAALDKNMSMFALQNGGQCFGGRNAEGSFRKYGPSAACCGDGEGGPWSNEVYSFLDNRGQPIVNANYNPWSVWSPCSQTCNNGTNNPIQMRNRTCFTIQTPYFMPMPGCFATPTNTVQTRPCVVQICLGSPGAPSPAAPGSPRTTLPAGPGRPGRTSPAVPGALTTPQPSIQPPTSTRGTLVPPTVQPTRVLPPTQGLSSVKPPTTPFTVGPPAFPSRPATGQPQVCLAKVDLGFLIDGSGSIEKTGKGNFKKELDFVKDIVRGFQVSTDGTHVGVILFSNVPRVVSDFDEHYEKSSILAAIGSISYPSGNTHTGKALDLARNRLYGRSARHGIPDMLIVITDGYSEDAVSEPAQRLRDSGVTIFSVGIGRGYNVQQLRDMATDPDSQHVYKADFNNLDAIVKSLKDRACMGSGGATQAPPTGSSTLGLVPQVCEAKVDLAILIDGSQSIEYFAKGNFKRCLEFVKNLLRGFNIARDGTHAGIVVFSHIAEVVFGFEKYLSLSPMLQTIDNIKYPQSSTYTGKALDVVRTQLFEASARQGVPNVLLIMTDGASQDDVEEPSKRLRDMGVTIFTLGVGRAFDINQLNAMATDPDREHVFTCEFSQLGSRVIERIKSKACKGGGGMLRPWQRTARATVRTEESDASPASGTAGTGPTRDVQMSSEGISHMKGTEGERIKVRWKTIDGRVSTGVILGPGKQESNAAGEKSTGGARKGLTQSLGGEVMDSLVAVPKVGAVKGGSSEGRTERLSPSDGMKLLRYNNSINGSEVHSTKSIEAGHNSTRGEKGTSLRGAKAFGVADVLNEAFNKLANREIHFAAGRNETLRGLTGNSRYESTKGDYSVGSAIKRIHRQRSREHPRSPKPVALFPLNQYYQARDVIGGNPPGEAKNVIPAAGPYNGSKNSLSFLGAPDSFIEFPNDGGLDTRNCLSLLAWILPLTAGPIFNYMVDGWGVNFWMAKPRKLFARFVDRENNRLIPAVKSTHVKPAKWNFVGATYNQQTGQASLWINGKLEDVQYLGNISLATNYSVRMGVRVGDKRYFRGRISCMQVYDVALNWREISVAKRKCRPYSKVSICSERNTCGSQTTTVWD